jgi:hypothetical protein
VSRWRSLPQAMFVYSWVVLAVLAAVLPGHWGHALNEAKFGETVWVALLVSLGCELEYGFRFLTPIIILTVLLPRRNGHVALATGLISGALITLWVFILVAVEFRIQRGIYPTWFDVTTASGDAGFLRGSIGILWLARYLLANILSWLAAIIAMTMFARGLRSLVFPRSGHAIMRSTQIIAAVLTGIFTIFFGFQIWVGTKHLGGITDRSEYRSPVEFFFVGPPWHGGTAKGIGTATESTRAAWTEIVTGARMLGWAGLPSSQPPSPPDGMCLRHPLAEPFKVGRPTQPVGNDLEQAIDRLGLALQFRDARPLLVWHVMLESVRSDDIAAQNPAADARVTPWMNSLYNAAFTEASAIALDRDLVVAGPRVWGSGARSSQSLAGMLCGIGMMPFAFSAARDFGFLPLRCLQDVLKDGGFTTRVYFGAGLKFDEKRTFYRRHGIETREAEDVPKQGMIRGAWGITDRSLATWVSNDIASDQSLNPRPMHVLVTTVTNHPPFTAPSDAPPEMNATIREIAIRHKIDKDEAQRLLTTSYTDLAVRELFDRVRKLGLANRSVFVLAGDHSVGTPSAWASSSSKGDVGHRRVAFQIPFALIFPQELIERVKKPQLVAHAVARLNDLLAKMDFSQNDEPRILLRLLSSSGHLDKLLEAWRWHTLGGQRMAANAQFAPVPEATVWGTDALTRLSLLGSDGRVMTIADGELQPPLGTKDLRSRAGILGPIISVLGHLLREGKNCQLRAVE